MFSKLVANLAVISGAEVMLDLTDASYSGLTTNEGISGPDDECFPYGPSAPLDNEQPMSGDWWLYNQPCACTLTANEMVPWWKA